MRRTRTASIVAAALFALTSGRSTAFAQAGLAGQWTLDRDASQFPREIGFGINWATSGESGESGRGGGRSGSGGGGSTRNMVAPRESAEDATRLRALTNEVRNPSTQLTIVESPTAITITSDGGRARTFHPTGRQEVLRLDGDVPLVTTARRDGDRLVVVYEVEEGRQLRYTYSAAADPRQLIVEVQFLERGKGDSVRRVYEAVASGAPVATPPTPMKPAQPPTAGAPTGGPPVGGAAPASQAAASGADLRPGAELKGLTRLGVVVEGIGAQAIACGLTQDALDKAVSKSLSEAGLQILRNTDEDTYLYVNVMATTVSAGLCVSRYDATLYTHTTATLPYTSGPVLVQVELLRNAGIAGGAPAANAQAVVRGVTQFVDQFVTRIRDANKK